MVDLLFILIPGNAQDIFRKSQYSRIIDGGGSKFSPDQILVVVQSLLGHVLDEGGVLQLQFPRNRHDQRGGVEDVDLHLALGHRRVLFSLGVWRHLEDSRHIEAIDLNLTIKLDIGRVVVLDCIFVILLVIL